MLAPDHIMPRRAHHPPSDSEEEDDNTPEQPVKKARASRDDLSGNQVFDNRTRQSRTVSEKIRANGKYDHFLYITNLYYTEVVIR